jgi:predicted MPP superfamily phosphohydrolase
MKNALTRRELIAAATAGGVPAVKTAHSSTATTAEIQIRGLAKAITVLHVADSHISVRDDSEKAYHSYAARMDKAFVKVKHFKTGKTARPADHFVGLMTAARTRQVDLITLTGDIVNNPSKSSVAFVEKAVRDTGIESLFIAGNHDWHYEGEKGTADELRKKWTTTALAPLYRNRDPLCYAVQSGGINFVAIDDSTFQVNDKQLAFFKAEASRGLPTVLLVHIPLHLSCFAEGDVSTCGNPKWGWDNDRGYKVERRGRWPNTGNRKSTVAFVETVRKTENLVATLAGHEHCNRADALSTSTVQYLTAAACSGHNRIVTFRPMTVLEEGRKLANARTLSRVTGTLE